MMQLHKLKIRSQLTLLLAIVIGLFLVAAFVSYQALSRSKVEYTRLINHDQQLLLNFTELYANGLQMGQAMRNIILDPANPKAYQNFEKASKEMDALLLATQPLAKEDSKISGDLASVLALRDKQSGLQKQLLDLVKSDQIDMAKALLNEQETPTWRSMRTLLLDQIKSQKDGIVKENQAVEARTSMAQNTSLIISLVAVAVGVLIGLLIVGNIVSQLKTMTESMENLAKGEGDLTARLPVHGDTELGRVAGALNRFITGVQEIVNAIKRDAGKLDQLSAQLASTSSGLREATREESNAVASTASSIEEMSASIASVADSTEQIKAVSQESAHHSELAREKMANLGSAMSSVQSAVQGMSGSVGQFLESTQSIIGATQHVKDIADQINLLALNAAIEAARAGEQGRGFAVVADEVRKLAEKTALYANEISQVTGDLGSRSALVETSIRQGEAALAQSSACSENAAAIMGQAFSTVVQATRGIEEIATSTREQSQATSQIARNVEKLSDVAASAEHAIEQSDKTMQEMSRLSADLNGLVSRFKS
jgi:methyl-accepting chemotaxis protein